MAYSSAQLYIYIKKTKIVLLNLLVAIFGDPEIVLLNLLVAIFGDPESRVLEKGK